MRVSGGARRSFCKCTGTELLQKHAGAASSCSQAASHGAGRGFLLQGTLGLLKSCVWPGPQTPPGPCGPAQVWAGGPRGTSTERGRRATRGAPAPARLPSRRPVRGCAGPWWHPAGRKCEYVGGKRGVVSFEWTTQTPTGNWGGRGGASSQLLPGRPGPVQWGRKGGNSSLCFGFFSERVLFD